MNERMMAQPQRTVTPSSVSARASLPRRKCACGSMPGLDGECSACHKKQLATQHPAEPAKTPRLGHDFSRVAAGLHPKLTIDQPGDALEQEADRMASAVVDGAATTLQPVAARAVPPAVQREETNKPPSDEEKYKEGAKKVGEAFLQTDVGKNLKDQAAKLGKDFLTNLSGKIIAGTAAAGAIAAIAATNSELPIQVPEIPLDALAPGLKMKLTYEGPVRKPTAASISFTYTLSGGGEKKPAMTEAEKFRAETDRLAAEQARFREGLKTPRERAADAAFWNSYWQKKSMGRLDPLGIPGLKPNSENEPPKPKKEDESVMRKAADGARPPAGVPPIVYEALESDGQPLDAATRAFMELRFGHDFSQVRVHTDARAAESAWAVNALAYTLGRDVVFGAGQYAPHTSEGKRLVAHELTHVVQQASRPVRPASSATWMATIDPSERLEQHAEETAASVRTGSRSNPLSLPRATPALPALPDDYEHVSTQHPPTAIQRQVAGAATPAIPDADSSTLSLVGGDDSQTLVDVMSIVEAVRPSEFASGMYITRFRGKTISLTQAQRDDLYTKAKAAIRKNLTRTRQKAESAKSGYEIQEEINEEHWFVAPIVLTFSGVRDKAPMLLAEVAKAGTSADASEKALQADNFTEAARRLAESEAAAIRASTLWREYHEGIIGSGEKTVTVLEYTRDASFITLGVLAIIATGGAAAGATTTAFGLQVGTVSAANLIATSAPIVATLGGAGVQAALGDKVDWTKVGVDIAVNLILSRFGGKLSSGIFKTMLGSPAVRSIGEVAFGRIVSSVLTHEASIIFTTTVDATYRKLQGQNVTWNQFTDELIARLSDPKGLVVASVMGAVVAGADVKLGGARRVEVTDKKGSPVGEIDVIRGGAIIEDKSARGLGTLNPRTGRPAQTEAQWAEKQIYDKTKVRIDNLKNTATATRPAPPQRPTPGSSGDAGGSRDVPSLAEVQRIRKYEFRIEADTPSLRIEVEKQLQRLKADHPDWTFSARYGE